MQILKIATVSLPADLKNIRVERVNLKVGKLSAVVPDSLRFCFAIVAKETPLAGADLKIEEIPINVRCRTCNRQWTVTEPVFTCKTCPNGSVDILSGRELDIVSLEVADE